MAENLKVNKSYFWPTPTAVLLFLYGLCAVGLGIYVLVGIVKDYAYTLTLLLPLLPLYILYVAVLFYGGYLLIYSSVILRSNRKRGARNKALMGVLLVLVPWWILVQNIFEVYSGRDNLRSDLPIAFFVLVNIFLFWQLYRISKSLPSKEK